MGRRSWMGNIVLVAGLVLAAGNLPETAAVALEPGSGQAELVDRLYSEGLTRAEMVGLYETLVQGEFEPPACTPGDTMFTDVPASHLFCAWIEELARRGITGGCTATEYCPGNPVTRGQMASFILRATADEPPHLVGQIGEPEFGNGGGEGDCLWMNATVLLPELGPVSFYKDSDGIVRIAGVARAVDGGGGDGVCGLPAPLGGGTDFSDNVIFILPPEYQPEHLLIFPGLASSSGGTLVVPVGGVVIDGFPLPAGAVLVGSVVDETAAPLDGITFRVGTGTTESLSREPSNISMEVLRALLFR